MISAAKNLGYNYIALTDHSKSDTIARGMDEKRLEKYIAAVRTAAKKYKGIKVLVGSEVYIRADGSLDFSDEALENKYVSIFGHPTTRQINIRPPVDFDKKEVFKLCAEKGIILEANASPI